jgi:hypothetical protein
VVFNLLCTTCWNEVREERYHRDHPLLDEDIVPVPEDTQPVEVWR